MEDGDHVQSVLEQWRRETPEIDVSPMAVLARIRRLALLSNAEIEPVFAAHGLNGGEFDVLTALRRAGKPFRLTPTELSRALIVTSGGMTRRLTALERRGLIRREPDATDGRSSFVRLTPQGRHLVETVLPEHVTNLQRLLDGMREDERHDLARLLAALAVSLGDRPAPQRRRHK